MSNSTPAPSKAPTAKVAAGGTAGAAVVVIVYLAGLFGLELPVAVATAAVVLVSFAAGYLVPDRSAGKHTAD